MGYIETFLLGDSNFWASRLITIWDILKLPESYGYRRYWEAFNNNMGYIETQYLDWMRIVKDV